MRHLRSLRFLHPFPSLLDGAATAAIAVLAGGPLGVAARLAFAMTLVQLAIGATNDVIDAPFDAGRPDKPVAAGVVPRRTALLFALACGSLGLVLAAISGPTVLALAILGLGLGLAYDLRLKRTAFAWLPFAAGIPLLVVFAWYGATGELRTTILVSLPAAALAGASLSLANALVDPEGDRRVGMVTPVLRIGGRASWAVAVVLAAGTVGLAIASLLILDARPPAVVAALAAGVLAVAGACSTRASSRDRRERAWEVEAVGMALLGAAWVAAVASVG
jgi:4-hydroxybenzoate polyprenyltransferase